MKINLLLPFGILFFGACQTDSAEEGQVPSLPDALYSYANPDLPDHFYSESMGTMGQEPVVDADNMPEDNPTTDEGATLGRVLFYDTHLSVNGTIACA